MRHISTIDSSGTWIPIDGSNPFLGTVGKIEVTKECIVSFTVKGCDIDRALKVILDVHPYEEPCIDIMPMLDWKKFV
jgi:hypothetical protein